MKWTFDENWKVTIFRQPEFAIRRCTIFGVFASSKLLVSLATWHPDRPSLLTCEVCPATRFKKKVIHGLLVGYTVDRKPMNIQYSVGWNFHYRIRYPEIGTKQLQTLNMYLALQKNILDLAFVPEPFYHRKYDPGLAFCSASMGQFCGFLKILLHDFVFCRAPLGQLIADCIFEIIFLIGHLFF